MKKMKKILLFSMIIFGIIINGTIIGIKAQESIKQLNIADGDIEISENGYKQTPTTTGEAKVDIDYKGAYEITGTSQEYSISIKGGTHNISIRDLSIRNQTSSFCPLSIENSSDVTLDIIDTNELVAGFLDGKLGNGRAGIEVSKGNKLTITGSGKLNVIGGAASAGIGGGPLQNGGDISITGGDLNIKGGGSTPKTYGGAGIGAGGEGVGGNIFIGGHAKVNVEGYRGGAGIGSSGIVRTPINAQQTITITDDAKVIASAALMQQGDSSAGAAIGGGYNCKGGFIEISGNARVEAIATDSGASIGGGNTAKFLDETEIIIKDNAYVKALGAGAVPCFGNGQFSTTQGTMSLDGNPIVFGYTYGKASPALNVEDKTIAATLTNLSSSVLLKGYFNMTDCLTDSGVDTYLSILTADKQNYVVEYSGVNNQYFSDYALITPSNSFVFNDYKGDALNQAQFGSKDTVKISYKNNTTTIKDTYAIKNNPTIEPSILPESGKGIEGWYLDTGLINKWDFNNNVTTDMDLYIKQLDIFTIDFVTNNGTIIDSQDVLKGNKVIEPLDLSKPGYTFEGWYTDTGLVNEWNFSSDLVSGDMTLYAKWEAIQYAVSIKEDQRKILKVQKDGVNQVHDTNSFVPTIKMQAKGLDIATDYSLLEWEVENIAGFESYNPVVKIDETTGKIIGLKSGVAKVTVKLKVGYDPLDTATYDSIIVIVPGNVSKTGSLMMYDATVIMRSLTQSIPVRDLVGCSNKEYLDELSDMDGDGVMTAYDATIIGRMISQNERPSN